MSTKILKEKLLDGLWAVKGQKTFCICRVVYTSLKCGLHCNSIQVYLKIRSTCCLPILKTFKLDSIPRHVNVFFVEF